MTEDKDAIIFALQQRAGMSPEATERLSKFNREQTDWYGTCRKCHKRLDGTIEQLRAHRCFHDST